jgi:predicted nucleic acid-binding Zn ribbon protein
MDPADARRRRRPDRIGDLLPEAARQLGLETELRLARATTTWDALIAERVPPAVGACRLVRLEPGRVTVEADEPIVASELRLRAGELLAAFAAAPGGAQAHELRIVIAGRGGGGRPT